MDNNTIQQPTDDRRRFIIQMTQSVGLASLGALVWGGFVDETKANTLILRPPASLAEEDFMATCIRCGLCVEACPYDTLHLAKPKDKVPFGTPFFVPRNKPCYMCTDIPCVPVCPSGALDKTSVMQDNKLDITKAKMGVAMVDTNSCIAYWGIQCDACYRVCPLMDKAIYLEYRKNERTGKHAYLEPRINPDICTGCGMCERACVTLKPAIFVLPQSIARGKVDNNYVKGWDKQDEKRVQNVDTKNMTTKTEISKKSAIDSLNSTKGLFDE